MQNIRSNLTKRKNSIEFSDSESDDIFQEMDDLVSELSG